MEWKERADRKRHELGIFPICNELLPLQIILAIDMIESW
jgi:hypothetical protein